MLSTVQQSSAMFGTVLKACPTIYTYDSFALQCHQAKLRYRSRWAWHRAGGLLTEPVERVNEVLTRGARAEVAPGRTLTRDTTGRLTATRLTAGTGGG
jgi:hypothetical protein